MRDAYPGMAGRDAADVLVDPDRFVARSCHSGWLGDDCRHGVGSSGSQAGPEEMVSVGTPLVWRVKQVGPPACLAGEGVPRCCSLRTPSPAARGGRGRRYEEE